MDRLCKTCNQITHDGKGACHFCGTPFPPLTKAEAKAAAQDAVPEVEEELADDELAMPTQSKKKH